MITLEIGGIEYSGFESCSVERNMDTKASTFNVSAFDSKDSPARAIQTNSICTIRENNEVIITGYIERKEVSFDAGSHTISFSGRSITCDILGCSPIDCPSQFINTTNVQIARKLCSPFGVNLIIDSTVEEKMLVLFELDQQDNIEALLEKLFVDDEAYIHDTPSGALRITAGTSSEATKNKITINITEGISNVLSASYTEDTSEVVTDVEVIAQQESTDENYGTATAQIKGGWTNKFGTRRRVLRQAAEKAQTQSEAEEEAKKEGARRLSQVFSVTYTLQGWRGSADWLWFENELVEVYDEMLGKESNTKNWLITGVSYSLDANSGTTVTLQLKIPEAYQGTTPSSLPSIWNIFDTGIVNSQGGKSATQQLKDLMEEYDKKFPDRAIYD